MFGLMARFFLAASIFGRLLLRAAPGTGVVVGVTPGWKNALQAEERKKAAFLYHFLTNNYDE